MSIKILSVLVIITLLSASGCGPKMESSEEAAYNDAVAACIFRNGNPPYPSPEYNRLEAFCDRMN